MKVFAVDLFKQICVMCFLLIIIVVYFENFHCDGHSKKTNCKAVTTQQNKYKLSEKACYAP